MAMGQTYIRLYMFQPGDGHVAEGFLPDLPDRHDPVDGQGGHDQCGQPCGGYGPEGVVPDIAYDHHDPVGGQGGHDQCDGHDQAQDGAVPVQDDNNCINIVTKDTLTFPGRTSSELSSLRKDKVRGQTSTLSEAAVVAEGRSDLRKNEGTEAAELLLRGNIDKQVFQPESGSRSWRRQSAAAQKGI